MTSRWSSIAIVLFWISTMGWLVQNKIIPSLATGEPPSYRSMLDHHGQADRPVGWSISLDGRPLGWAITSAVLDTEGGYQLQSRVRMDRIPFATLAPAWMSSILKVFDGGGSIPSLQMNVDARSSIDIDPLGRPVDFDSVANLGYPGQGRTLATDLRFSMRGTFEGDYLDLEMRSGDFVHHTKAFVPRDAMLGDSLSPQARLPHLRLGQTWTVPAYSPFRPPNSPLEILDARVERTQMITWHGRQMPTLVVVMHADPGSGLTNSKDVRAKTWVAMDGSVLKQEVLMGTGWLRFTRVAKAAPTIEGEAEDLEPWWNEAPSAAPPLASSPAIDALRAAAKQLFSGGQTSEPSTP
jgi:hypothetical protein